MPQWPRSRVVISSLLHKRIKDRFVIGLKVKEKHIHVHKTWEYNLHVYACDVKTGKHENEAIGAKVE
jgi:hypothetical protein